MELPEGWVEVELGKVCEKAKIVQRKNVEPESKLIYLDIGAIDSVTNQIIRHKEYTWKDAPSRAQQIVHKDDILFSTVRTYLRNIAQVETKLYDGQIASSGFTVIRGNPVATNPKFLFYLTLSQSFLQPLNELQTGTSYPAVRDSDVFSQKIPLPPLPEQHRIVAKIEALFTSLDRGIASLKTAQQQLKIYSQAVLKWAFEGKLTEVWRAQQKTLPDGKEILTLLKSEKKEVCQKKGIKLKDTQPISSEELSELPELPIQMAWARLNDLIWSVKDGPHYSPSYQESGIPFISGGNIKQDGIDFKKAKYISVELHEELSKRCKPEKGDILYTKGGTTGIARVNTYDFEFNVWVHVAVLKHLPSINPFYLQHVLNSQHCYNQSQKYTHGVGNQDLGLTRMILITLPICSLEEQNQIVAAIESRLSVCDKLEETILQSLQQAEALRQSILKKAFAGQLVPQDPNDEPASVLLERIRAERLKATTGKIVKNKKSDK